MKAAAFSVSKKINIGEYAVYALYISALLTQLLFNLRRGGDYIRKSSEFIIITFRQLSEMSIKVSQRLSIFDYLFYVVI